MIRQEINRCQEKASILRLKSKLRNRKNEEISMVPSYFFPEVVPVSVRQATSPSLGIISSVLLAIAIVALPSQASGRGAWCTAPYVQVAGPDNSGGNPGGLHIQSLSIGEPFASCSARSLTVVIKVDTLDPGN